MSPQLCDESNAIIPYTLNIRITKFISTDSLYHMMKFAIGELCELEKETVTYQSFLFTSAILGVKVIPFLRSLWSLVVLLTTKTFLIVFVLIL
jgi:hypothetical protein